MDPVQRKCASSTTTARKSPPTNSVVLSECMCCMCSRTFLLRKCFLVFLVPILVCVCVCVGVCVCALSAQKISFVAKPISHPQQFESTAFGCL